MKNMRAWLYYEAVNFAIFALLKATQEKFLAETGLTTRWPGEGIYDHEDKHVKWLLKNWHTLNAVTMVKSGDHSRYKIGADIRVDYTGITHTYGGDRTDFNESGIYVIPGQGITCNVTWQEVREILKELHETENEQITLLEFLSASNHA